LGNISIENTKLLDIEYEAIMRGEVPSHVISRRLPARLPKADWQSIRRYLFNPANLENPQDGESLISEESEPFSERMSKEQIAYQLGVLKQEEKQEAQQQAEYLLLKQSQEKAIKEYIQANFEQGTAGPVIVAGLNRAIEAGKLVYDGEINNGKVMNWS